MSKEFDDIYHEFETVKTKLKIALVNDFCAVAYKIRLKIPQLLSINILGKDNVNINCDKIEIKYTSTGCFSIQSGFKLSKYITVWDKDELDYTIPAIDDDVETLLSEFADCLDFATYNDLRFRIDFVTGVVTY
jgi:hypothetical protein